MWAHPSLGSGHADLKATVLSSPILSRADSSKRFYLKTDFSSLDMGYALCQPDNSAESLAAMDDENNEGKCQFDLCLSKLRLHPVASGSRKCLRNEKKIHSYVGEATAAAWAITKNRHFYGVNRLHCSQIVVPCHDQGSTFSASAEFTENNLISAQYKYYFRHAPN